MRESRNRPVPVRSRWAAGGIGLAIIATAAAVPATEDRQGAAGRPAYVAGPDGTVYRFSPGGGSLEPARLPWPRIIALAPLGEGGALLVLLPPEPEGRRPRHAPGRAVLLDAGGPSPTLRREIPLACEGREVVAAPGGRRAYVLGRMHAADRSGDGPVDAILEIDPDTGRTVASARLASTAASMALDAGGQRLYVSVPDRILTFTTAPLARSWQYRSPGENGALTVRREGEVLTVLRGPGLAIFDPGRLADLPMDERRSRPDQASTVLRLPFAPQGLAVSSDGRAALAWRPGSPPLWIDLVAAAAAGQPEGLAPLPEGGTIQALPGPDAPASLRLALFPELSVVVLPLPSLVPASAASPSPAPDAQRLPPPAPSRPPAVAPLPTVAGPEPGPPSPAGDRALRGRIEGRIDRVEAIVVYGPGSIVREQARAAPAADGSWEVPLPPPGAYRVLPLGPGSRPVRSIPNFHTLAVEDRGQSGIDFRVE